MFVLLGAVAKSVAVALYFSPTPLQPLLLWSGMVDGPLGGLWAWSVLLALRG